MQKKYDCFFNSVLCFFLLFKHEMCFFLFARLFAYACLWPRFRDKNVLCIVLISPQFTPILRKTYIYCSMFACDMFFLLIKCNIWLYTRKNRIFSVYTIALLHLDLVNLKIAMYISTYIYSVCLCMFNKCVSYSNHIYFEKRHATERI